MGAAAALGGARGRVVAATCAFAALLLACAGIGAYFLADVSGVILDAVMSFGVAALLTSSQRNCSPKLTRYTKRRF